MLLKRTFFILLAFLSLLLPFTPASAAGFGLDTTADAAGLGEYKDQDLPTIIGNIIGTGLSMIGVLFFILMVYGGFLWMTAHGNEDQSKKAFNTIIAATIGIIIVLAAYAITNFVFSSVWSSGTAGGTNGRCISAGIATGVGGADCSSISCPATTDPTRCTSTGGCCTWLP